ncbi:hypothetical protein C8R47DRAFT_453942 [Mycena vitilis]|nr:hypothetical protein C8R47DRAFT_453942 [Mycena vitilis]
MTGCRLSFSPVSPINGTSSKASYFMARTLLLRLSHPCGFLRNCSKNQRERDKFDAYVAEFSGKPRPRLRCPCGSGRALEDCHSKAQPYPEEGLCPCGTGRICEKCCVKRHDMYWVEVWDPRTVRLQRLCVPPMAQNPEIEKTAEDPATHVVDQAMREKVSNWTQAILKGLAEHGEIDPAYAAAGFKLQTSPLYPKLVQSMSKMDVNDSTRMWNAAVDEYIASGVDSRPTDIIENAAKVGLAGGPLYRRCEAGGCPSLEYRKGVKLSLCSRCEKAVYCGRTCQKTAWKTHRSACRAGTVNVQLLPSQEAYTQQLGFGIQEISSTLRANFAESEFAVVQAVMSFVDHSRS